MDKTAIKNFATWARNKLIVDITYKAGLMGITEKGIADPLPQSTPDMQFFDIGTALPHSILGSEIGQRKKLVEVIEGKAKSADHQTAFSAVVEEVAYTWFNRLIAVRFMEANDYLPSRVRVLSSESSGKIEPDLVTAPFEADLDFTDGEKEQIAQMKRDNKLDELFRMLFIKQCNALNAFLPELFETTNDYTELLLNISFTDQGGVLYHLLHDIAEDDFRDAVEIIGWLYQYYNTEPKQQTFDLLKKNVKITKERIPAATQLFTPDWIVRYMVENSLGRYWIEQLETQKHFDFNHIDFNNFSFGENEDKTITKRQQALKDNWKYYIEEAEQDEDVQKQLYDLRMSNKNYHLETIKFIDPCMGSGHILIYAFDALMQLYESGGYTQRDAAAKIIENNLYGLDIDNRAYQLAYFAVMMKGRAYDRQFLKRNIKPNLCAVQESNGLKTAAEMGYSFDAAHMETADYLINTFKDAKEYGSLLSVEQRDYDGLERYIDEMLGALQDKRDLFMQKWLEAFCRRMHAMLRQAKLLAQRYDVVCTNPPYMGSGGMNSKLGSFVKKNYPDSKSDLFAAFIERCKAMTKEHSYFAMITQHAWMFLSSFEKLREKLMQATTINMAHLGPRAFAEIGGEVVQSTAFVMCTTHIVDYVGTYVRLIDFPNAEQKEQEFLSGSNRYIARAENFTKIPGMPVAYWVSENWLLAFDNKPLGDFAEPRQGFATGDNNRFLRFWSEVSFDNSAWNVNRENNKWFPCNKGGTFRKWYGNNDIVANWENDGEEMRSFSGSVIRNPSYYFKPGITWSTLANELSMRYSPKGFLFESKGSVCFVKRPENLSYLLGLLNSKAVISIMRVLSPTLDFHEGPVSRIPVAIDENMKKTVETIVKNNISISNFDWDSFETSWDFTRHPLVSSVYKISLENALSEKYVEASYMEWKTFIEGQFLQLKANEEELNRIFIDIYGLQDELTPDVADKDITVARIYDAKEDIPESMKGNGYVLTKADVVKSFISYAVGCMFGRYSLDVDSLAYAGGDWDDSKYSSFIPDKDNILPITDEEYYEDDIVGLFVAFVRKVYGTETLEENLDFIANALGGKGTSSREIIRVYFLKDFFKDHCKTYKKRPIYWLFDSGKQNGFKALVYMHRYNEDTIGNLRTEYLHRIQQTYTREMARMQETIDNSTNGREVAAAEKRKEKLIKQLKETTDYDEKIGHLAVARIGIDLDDGVKVNYEKVQTDKDGNKLAVLGKIG